MRTKKDYELAISKSHNIADVARALNLLPRGANYDTIKRYIVKYNLDISHFTGMIHNLSHIDVTTSMNNLSYKKKLISTRGHKCERCNNEKWLDAIIPLQLEHVDGNNTNYIFTNLELLCPNCHAQTTTFRKGKGIYHKSTITTCSCGSPKTYKATFCQTCYNKKRNTKNQVLPTRKKLYPFKKKDFFSIIEISKSLSQVIRNLSLPETSGSRQTVKQAILEFNVDTSHFTGQLWSKGTFILENPTTRTPIKNRLLVLRGHQCERCELSHWNGKLISLELEHIDGNNKNNENTNLLLLCGNCHALTSTYCRKKSSLKVSLIKKNITKQRLNKSKNTTDKNKPYKKPSIKCPHCDNLMQSRSSMCSVCAHKKQEKTNWPFFDELITQLKSSSYSAVARTIGVSDNAIRKRLRNRGYDVKTLEKLNQ